MAMMLVLAAAAAVLLAGFLSGPDAALDEQSDSETLAAAVLAAIGPI